MPRIEEIHIVRLRFDVVWPTGRFNEGSTSLINKCIDGRDKFPKMNGGVRVQLIDSNLSNGCSQHMPDIPPTSNYQW